MPVYRVKCDKCGEIYEGWFPKIEGWKERVCDNCGKKKWTLVPGPTLWMFKRKGE